MNQNRGPHERSERQGDQPGREARSGSQRTEAVHRESTTLKEVEQFDFPFRHLLQNRGATKRNFRDAPAKLLSDRRLDAFTFQSRAFTRLLWLCEALQF